MKYNFRIQRVGFLAQTNNTKIIVQGSEEKSGY